MTKSASAKPTSESPSPNPRSRKGSPKPKRSSTKRSSGTTAATAGAKAARKSAPAAVAGTRVGTKKRDMRWQAPDGAIWASRFEYAVFTALKDKGYNVRKTGPQDSLGYSDPTPGARCTKCGNATCSTGRSYTPDILVGPAGSNLGHPDAIVQARGVGEGPYYIEAKGYIRSDRRRLLRAVRKALPSLNLRLIVQRDYKVTSKLTLVEWVTKFLKVPVHVWNGDLPEGWK